MNRNELIEFLRDPSSLKEENLAELENIITEAPYFQSARMLLAKASGILKNSKTKSRTASAAIYATDRPLLKKYMSGSLLFLTKPPGETSEEQVTQEQQQDSEDSRDLSSTTQATTQDFGKLVIPGIPEGALDSILEELEQDMEDLKESRMKFADLQKNLDESSESPNSEESVPDQITAEVTPEAEIEQQEVSEALDSSEEAIEDGTFEKEVVEEQNSDVVEPPGSLEMMVTPQEEIKEIETPETETPTAEPKVEEKKEDFTAEISKSLLAEVISEVKKEAENDFKEETEARGEKPKEVEGESFEKITNIEEATEPQPESSEKESTLESTPLNDDKDYPEIKLESELKREERRERRMQRRASRLSDLNQLNESSIKELEAQMWGDEDSNPSVKDEKEEEKPKPAKKAVAKKTPAKSSKEAAEKSEEKIEAGTEKEAVTKKSATVKKSSTVKKSTAKATPAKKPASKEAPDKKTTSKKTSTTTKKATTSSASKSTKKKTTSSSSKGTSKTPATKRTTKKKDDDDGKGDPKANQSKIIDRFIEDNPGISRPVELRETSDEDLSDLSSAWNKDLASEHLAEIYLQQGNKKRAIEIYEALSLKFPEKKSYFADLISKIK